MKKILIAFDGTRFSDGAFEFARQLNELQPMLLTGVFLPQVSYANLWSYTDAMSVSKYSLAAAGNDTDVLENNIGKFEELCKRHHINFGVHKDFNDFALPELKRETRFADLLIISSERFFENMGAGSPSEYMKDAIHEAECPVIVIPENFSFPRRNVIAYDGSASAVYAMKQFAYVLPELAVNPTLMVHSKDKDDLKLLNHDYIEELAKQHYKEVSIQELELNQKKDFNSWLKKEGSPILICGAFGRSSLSQLFRKSFVTEVIADHKLPVFIAHQ